jgi:hypothetical protein
MPAGRPKLKPGEGKKTKPVGIRIAPDVMELKQKFCPYEDWTPLVNRLMRDRYKND